MKREILQALSIRSNKYNRNSSHRLCTCTFSYHNEIWKHIIWVLF